MSIIICNGNFCRIIREDILSADVLQKICTFLFELDVPHLLSVSKYFYHNIRPFWCTLVNRSPFLQKKKRFFYHSVAKSLSIVYCAIEQAQMKKFNRINHKLGVSVYTYVNSGVNVFARVRPPSMGHTVGIRYTFDRWKEEHITYGWWVENQNNEELWRINISFDEDKSEEMWFSVFVKDSYGQEAWDANNGWNYTAHINTIPINTYDECHPAIRQHQQTRPYPKSHKKYKREESEETTTESEDFIEEVWFNTNNNMLV